MRWVWVRENTVLAIHSEQIAAHGGEDSIRDAGLLSSALARPQQLAHYGKPSVFDLAAAYAFGIIRNHPFIDGNKRTGFLVCYVFLAINDYKLVSDEVAVVQAVTALADGTLSEKQFSQWLKKQCVTK